jgi:hypothetical protein
MVLIKVTVKLGIIKVGEMQVALFPMLVVWLKRPILSPRLMKSQTSKYLTQTARAKQSASLHSYPTYTTLMQKKETTILM